MNIVDILKERASNDLNKEIQEYISSIRDHKFYTAIKNLSIIEEDGTKTRLWDFLSSTGSAKSTIFNRYIEEKIHKVTVDFMKKVENNNEQ